MGGGLAAVIVAAGAGLAALLAGGGTAAGAAATITDIQVANGEYEVWFQASGFTPSQVGDRIRFYWNTSTPEDSGSPGDWWGDSPVSVAAVSDRPQGATQLCATVVSDTGVQRSPGNCRNLPS
jgi:hypothetical protein